MGPEGQLARDRGTWNKEWWGYGIPVIASSAGVVIYVRDDISENRRSGVLPSDNFYESIADPLGATAGNRARALNISGFGQS